MLVKHPRPFQTFPKPCFHLDPTTGVFYIGTIMTIQKNLICIRNQVDYPDIGTIMTIQKNWQI